VDVQAFCNFQPSVIAHWHNSEPAFWDTASPPYSTVRGSWSGARKRITGAFPFPWFLSGWWYSNLDLVGGNEQWNLTFPISPCLYNDAEALLTALGAEL